MVVLLGSERVHPSLGPSGKSDDTLLGSEGAADAGQWTCHR